jgi:hypothetical protein
VDLNPPAGEAPRTSQEIAEWGTLKADLGITTARRLVAWNLSSQRCFATSSCGDDTWAQTVEADGLVPELVLQGSHTGATSAPSPSTYRSAFGALLAHFEPDASRNHAPPVVLWGAWNEPNVPANLTSQVPAGAIAAADYWREAHEVLTAYCDNHSPPITGCTVAAGEFSGPAGGFYAPGGYIYTYDSEILRDKGKMSDRSNLPPVVFPTTWAAHVFVDLENAWRTPPYSYPDDLSNECTKLLQPDA